ncbi:hypothetical protein FRB99_008061 [Tulasnella sp. 403]|nr:hypothetical protein FRB99_008061 [Tulasnella sp. 403]
MQPNATIHALPLETIAEVFQLVLHKADPYPTALHRLAQVCIRWRDLVLSHPSFWAIIDEAYGRRWANWAVKKAKNVPLTFVYMTESRRKAPDVRAFVTCLRQNLHRCGVVIIAPRGEDTNSRTILKAVQQVLHTPNLCLSSFVFYIRRCGPSDASPPTAFLRGVTHKTRQARVMNISASLFRNGPPLARSLTHLNVFFGGKADLGMDWDQPLQFNALVDALRSSPALESLELERVKFTGIPSDVLPPVHLPKLKSLIFMDKHGETCTAHALLGLIDAPNCALLCIWVRFSYDETWERVRYVLDTPTIRTVCGNTTDPSYSFGEVSAEAMSDWIDRIGISVVSADRSSRIHMYFDQVNEKLLAFQHIFSQLSPSLFSIRALTYSILGHSPTVHSAFTRQFPLVDTLVVDVTRATSDEWEGFLGILTTRDVPDGGHLVWPHLQSLTVLTGSAEIEVMEFDPQPIFDFLRTRIGTMGTRPRKFKQLRFKGICDGLLEVEPEMWAGLVEDFRIEREEE